MAETSVACVWEFDSLYRAIDDKPNHYVTLFIILKPEVCTIKLGITIVSDPVAEIDIEAVLWQRILNSYVAVTKHKIVVMMVLECR